MDPAEDIAELLTRRAKATPERAGLPTYGKRRVPRPAPREVASLAGVSVEDYKRQGRENVSGVSELGYETMKLSADDGLAVAIFTAEPGSPSHQGLDLLAS